MWDDTVSEEVQKEWTKWKGKLLALEEIEIQRCIKPADFGRVVESSIHHFQMHPKTDMDKPAT